MTSEAAELRGARRSGAGALGDAAIVEHDLQPRDAATSRRLTELICATEPAALELSDPGNVAPTPPAPPDDVWVWRGWMRTWTWVTTRAKRLRPRLGLRAASLGVAVILVGVVPLGLGLVVGWGAVLGYVGTCLGVLVAVAALTQSHRWGRFASLPSELSAPEFDSRSVQKPDVLDDPRRGKDPAVAPLLEPRWTTGILTEALGLQTRDGVLDFGLLVDSLARLDVPARFPRRKRRSIDAGAQVIVDFSDDMLPFRTDVSVLLARLHRVLGDDSVTVLRFAGMPMTEIGLGRRATWGPYQPPHKRQPVLVITNFGLSISKAADDERARRREWALFVHRLQRQECPVIALVPNATARVPEHLRAGIAVVEWDRTTTAASARRAVRG